MKRFLLTAACVAIFTASAGQVKAGFIVGNFYLDSNNVAWEHVGQFNVTDGAPWFNGGPTFNGLEAAEAVFGALGANQEYALSTDVDNETVDHLAWYDGWGDTSHLNLPGQVGLPEDINPDPDGDGYNNEGPGNGDWSAYIFDHANVAADSINYVFVRDVANVAVPEPASLAIFGLGAMGLVAGGIRRRKQSKSA